MLRSVAASICLLLACATPFAQRSSSPAISTVFPPPRETRKPDLTISALGGRVELVAYTANGRTLLTAGADHIIRLWEARPGAQGTGALIRELAGHTARIRAIGSGAVPNTVVSIADDNTVRTWDETTGALIGSAAFAIGKGVERYVIRPGKEPVAAALMGSRITLLNYETASFLRNFDLQGATAASIAFSNDGKTLATGSDDGNVRLWNLDAGTLIRTFRAHQSAVHAVAFDPRAEQLATGGSGGIISVWDVASGDLLAKQQGHTGDVLSIAFSSNGQKMASGSADTTARTWTVPLPSLPSATLERVTAATPAKSSAVPGRPRRILVVWRADAILHKTGVPAVNHAIETMSQRTGAFEADFTRDVDAFDPQVLSKYDAIVMNSTAHLILSPEQRRAYLDYARGGGGVVGIHAAIDMFLTWPEGAEVIGATFGDHPWGPNGTWAVKLEQPSHPLLRAFGGKSFTIKDEFYVMGEPYSRSDRRVLMSVDLSDHATGGVNLVANAARAKDKDFALAWTKSYGKGRVFYANFGHIVEPLERPEIQQFYLDGIQWVLGDLKVD